MQILYITFHLQLVNLRVPLQYVPADGGLQTLPAGERATIL